VKTLNCARFAAMGHHRGARVTHRLAIDHPEVVEGVVVIDIARTELMNRVTDEAFSRCR
jgi:haloacetate dehalogenase